MQDVVYDPSVYLEAFELHYNLFFIKVKSRSHNIKCNISSNIGSYGQIRAIKGKWPNKGKYR